ncbi:MAG: hypothetical protein HKN13_15020 [Rhodothermales bacterium]|nr:hypothetical protein [Rhodothermales bacterium]
MSEITANQQRLASAFDLEQPDRPPILGGWLASPEAIQEISNCSEDQYWDDTFGAGLRAERALGSDGVIGIFEPVAAGTYRCVDDHVLNARSEYSVDTVLQEIDLLPDVDELEEGFDEEAAFRQYLSSFKERQHQCGDLLWCPAEWQVIPHGLWYHEYGYETAMLTLALHPDRYRRLIDVSAIQANQRARIVARGIREGITPRAVLTGEDLCSQEGPMVSPDYLRREYFPRLEFALEPLIDAEAQIVWHCDGAYGRLLDDVLACGITGLQGFQKECGMDLENIVTKRTNTGNQLLIFGPMSVTNTLPYGSEDDIREVVRWSMEVCRDNASLVFFTSNTITPDIPLQNIRTYWDAVLGSRW